MFCICCCCRICHDLATSAAAVVSAVAAAMTSWPQEEASASMCSWISRTIRIRFSVLKGEWKMFFLFDLDMVHVFGQVIIWQEKDNCTNQVNQTQIYTSRCPTLYCLTICQHSRRTFSMACGIRLPVEYHTGLSGTHDLSGCR